MALTEALEAEDKYLRNHAATALGNIGPAARTAVPALTRSLRDADEEVRGEAAEALGRIGGEAKSAVGELVQLLNDQRRAVRRRAATALKLIDYEAARQHLGLLPALERWIERNQLKKPKKPK
jgi:HEAT repeat protein